MLLCGRSTKILWTFTSKRGSLQNNNRQQTGTMSSKREGNDKDPKKETNEQEVLKIIIYFVILNTNAFLLCPPTSR